MARPKAFDVDVALDAALHAFWHNGYERTSLRDLLDAMGISRQSLYDTFGSKHELYLTVLDRYAIDARDRVTEALQSREGLAGVHALLQTYAAFVTDPQGARSCLMTNASLELGPHDEPTRVRVQTHLRWSEDQIVVALYEAQRRGELGADTEVRGLARTLVSTLSGMGVLARSGASRAEVLHVVDTTIAMLPSQLEYVA
ncbi:MAG: TetR/AcrR family transcriptional regulator [Alphaproteobacteria bacterium]|nr:TetR/AcrR family transcriptional regulator [Alphaproteobacteria bacterium]